MTTGWSIIYAQCRKVKPELPPDYAEAVKTGLFKWAREGEPNIGLGKFRQDPKKNPLTTPTGKIEIFSKHLWELSRTWELPEGDVISALPEYHPTWAGPEQAKGSAYPLQCVGHHYKQRTHSSYGNNPWLQEAAPQMLWINTLDAEKRGIGHGDLVRVFNQYGHTLVRAKVTPRIMPGVVSLPQGAWHRPDENGVDQNGCINVLTSHHPSPLAKGNPQHSNLVQVEKAPEVK